MFKERNTKLLNKAFKQKAFKKKRQLFKFKSVFYLDYIFENYYNTLLWKKFHVMIVLI